MLGNKSVWPLRVILPVAFIVVLVQASGAWAASRYKILHIFTNKSGNGLLPGLVFDEFGNLYGVTEAGGAHNVGAVFKLTPNADGSWTESLIHSFTTANNEDGDSPLAGLVFDTAGNLYGTTGGGGTYGVGAVFRLTPGSDGRWIESLIYSFLNDGRDGSGPSSPLIFDSFGNLYGTTFQGGVYGMGTVFRLTPESGGGWTESVLYDFTGGDLGGTPKAGVIFDAGGNLYGTTQSGGPDNVGLVYKLRPSKGVWSISAVHGFSGGRDGGIPESGSLIMDPEGNLYGTTSVGGLYEWGVIFELMPHADGNWTERVLHQFAGGKDGGLPIAGLTFDGTGNLYGTAQLGGNFSCGNGFGCGVVFKLAPNSKGGWSETILHEFFGKPGVAPTAGVILDTAGNLYGTAEGNGGLAFEISP
jgi:uncharacterized repeat protein (TIGR03803 family)